MNINTSYKQTKYNVSKKANRSIKYIVIHNTGTTASAENNCKYFSGGNRNASADYFVNTDGSIYQFNADIKNYYSWHCGDGKGKYGISNANSIGIEVVSAGTQFTDAQKEAVRELVQMLLSTYGINKNNIVRHYDASRKICPAAYSGSTAKDKLWIELKAFLQGSASSPAPASASYKVKITATALNVRAGASTSYRVNTTVKKDEVYTIVEEKSGWGKLKSGAGWISLKYTQKV